MLPFVNMSDDAANEYFADGIAEELLNVLSKIRGLRVASHTSAFSFKGSKIDIPTVAQKLNVATILEGSVRKAANACGSPCSSSRWPLTRICGRTRTTASWRTSSRCRTTSRSRW